MTAEDRRPNAAEVEALAVLARRGRILAILVPPSVPAAEVETLAREVNGRLARLARRAELGDRDR